MRGKRSKIKLSGYDGIGYDGIHITEEMQVTNDHARRFRHYLDKSQRCKEN